MADELDVFKNYMKFLEGCCLKHPADYCIDKIISVEAWIESENDGPSGGALFQLEDGRYGAMEESQDYTGHGCQCSSVVEFYDTREKAIQLGLTSDLVSRLIRDRKNS